MNDQSGDIVLMVASATKETGSIASEPIIDRKGGERHAKFLDWFTFATPKIVDGDKVRKDLERIRGEVEEMLKALANPAVGDLKLSEVTIGVAISGEGNFAIATVGVEASVELKFSRESGT